METNTESTTAISNPLDKLQKVESTDINYIPVVVELTCSIRRKDSSEMKGLPGVDMNWNLGSAFMSGSKAILKGLTGEAELLIMPEIVGHQSNGFEFRRMTDDYWKGIRVPIPPDNENLKEHEKGKVCKIKFQFNRKAAETQYQKLTTIEEKIDFIQRGLVKKNDKGEVAILLDMDTAVDFALLSYCIKHQRVANSLADVDKSGKIMYYLFEKSSAINTKYTMIQKREEAGRLFSILQDNERKVDAVLIEFGETPALLEDLIEKIIVLDELYRKPENIDKFIKAAQDDKWETKLLIRLSVSKGKLQNPANTQIYYYNNSIMIGRTIDEAVLYLENKEIQENIIIRDILEKEINLK